jgi:hypothetical protein
MPSPGERRRSGAMEHGDEVENWAAHALIFFHIPSLVEKWFQINLFASFHPSLH